MCNLCGLVHFPSSSNIITQYIWYFFHRKFCRTTRIIAALHGAKKKPLIEYKPAVLSRKITERNRRIFKTNSSRYTNSNRTKAITHIA